MLWGFERFFFKLENYTSWYFHGISVPRTPADSMIVKQDILEAARKWAWEGEACYQGKYLKTVVEHVFFSLTFKNVTSSNSNKQMVARNTLKTASCLRWTHHFWCLGLLTFTLIFISFWFWSKAIGEDFKVTSHLWTSVMAFWGTLSKRGDKDRNGHSLIIQWKKNIITSFVVSFEAAEVSCWGSTAKRWYCWRKKCFEERATMASPPFVHSTQP